MQDIDFDEIDRAVSSAMKPPVAPPPADELPAAAPVSEPVAPAPASAIPAARRSAGRFMDVVHPSSDMKSRSAARSPESRPEPAPGPESDPNDDPAPVKPAEALESPFLPDAKVEKRPLGAFSSPEPAEQPSVPEESADETPPAAALPEEIDHEAAAVEEMEVAEDVPEGEAEPEAAAPAEPAEETPTGPTSITQQYKEQPATDDQPSGAIYDTESYHTALVHQPAKHSGALVIIWILALILVGAGAGAAVYFLVL